MLVRMAIMTAILTTMSDLFANFKLQTPPSQPVLLAIVPGWTTSRLRLEAREFRNVMGKSRV